MGRTRGSSPHPTQLEAKAAIPATSNAHFIVLERWTRCAGTVDTVCWNGGHGVLERWTRRVRGRVRLGSGACQARRAH
ncbi:hypothetical protein [Kibdelosporangium philippinense]|uniref:hypothetical protein n=1 Tax=Kibdelosporangium philippinense TaxID=211113 RepID=UPI00361F89AC